MRATCPECLMKAVATSRNQITDNIAEVYCQCVNHLCGCGFVAVIAVKHITKPSRLKTTSLLAEALGEMSKFDQEQVCKQAGINYQPGLI